MKDKKIEIKDLREKSLFKNLCAFMAASLSLSQIPVAGIEKSLDFFNQELI